MVKSNGNAFTSWKTGKESLMANDLSHIKSTAARSGHSRTANMPTKLHITKKKV